MVIKDLICRLNELDNELCMMARVGSVSNSALFVDLFGNSNGLPVIHLSDEMPLPSVKKCAILSKELEIWIDESTNHQAESNIYLVNTYDYDDGSYDFRYFKLVNISQDNDQVFLIGDEQDCEVLREHFDAFDENILDPN
ncbi:MULTISPECIES: hypothetical protein [unclassified Vibrio]|uniref:hypothetical protein n=1 Tax=unclassified Vibrio TaxID=2614977 RepID=UPI000C85E804|nr:MULTISPECIES: hypothetical protein [unclassified Vibrio]PMI22116.1 hypothetical protein BCU50_11395 [Vibrio sp. 10N.286.46.E10]PMI98125.1 hypothetical protein BCU34_17040 [Vibrio sp. 10N.286.45.E10]PTP07688.1 hypothetical protein CWO17_07940 [Vibrio sp. 10N.286.45.A3]PTQ24752.1 hypothetical protein CWO24_07185 [Vibrio sp. 10N.286.46.E10]TKE79895.1 hypothetical protein FCV56_16065 [Vibrio sp. F12]